MTGNNQRPEDTDNSAQFIEQLDARVDDRVRTTKVIITATPPDYGTASFDRLLQATLDAD